MSNPEAESEPSSPPVPATLTSCWECDARTEEPVSVPLPSPSGKAVTITLCPACYRTHYVALFASATAARPS
jgi:hypothetical protein